MNKTSMDINRILELSRLEMGKKEKENLEKDFSSILNFVKKLEKLNVKNVKPMNYPIDIYNIMREDKITTEKERIANSKKLIDSAPENKDGFIKVKSILE